MSKRQKLFFIISIILPFIIYIQPIITGNMPFWNDPARDLLSAWDNLKKPTLIGPTSGIPGIFYGPQWIWLLSIGLIFSKDPRVVSFLIIAIPYFIIMPYLLYRLSKDLFSPLTAIILWLIFIFCFGKNLNNIWNPNLAPLFYFCLIFVFYKTGSILKKQNIINFFLLGFLQGLLFNHQISFSVGIIVSWVLYFVIMLAAGLFRKKSNIRTNAANWFVNFFSFILGFVIILSPFFIFELRHGFSQIKSLFYTLSQAYVHNSTVVGQTGLSKNEIILKFIGRLSDLLSLPQNLSILVFVVLVVGLIIASIKSRKTDKKELNLLLFLFLNTAGVVIVYLNSKNPVWTYHFIGVETIYLFLLGILIKRIRLLEKLLLIWVVVLMVLNLNLFISGFRHGKTISPELITKKATVEEIYKDAGDKPFAYLAKNAAIYTFDYDYIFRWMATKYGYSPGSLSQVKTVYLIIPDEFMFDKNGFADNRTPEAKYITIKEWRGVDKTLIIKRELR